MHMNNTYIQAIIHKVAISKNYNLKTTSQNGKIVYLDIQGATKFCLAK